MENQKKWVALFEQIVGRKPSPEEFLAAKASDFDFKQIKQIANQSSPSTPPPAAADQISPTPPSEGSSLAATTPPRPENLVTSQPIPSAAPNKKKPWLWAIGALLLLLAGGYFYLDKTTGLAVAVEDFKTQVQNKKYEALAQNFSSEQVTWKKEDVESFFGFLEEENINLVEQVSNLTSPSAALEDEKKNRLLVVDKVHDWFGFFPTYRLTVPPLEYKVTSSVAGLKLDGKPLEEGKEISLGQAPFAAKAFNLEGKTDTGDLSVLLTGDLKNATANTLPLSVQSVDKPFTIKLPVDSSAVKGLIVKVGGTETKDKTSVQAKVLENQQIAVSARFDFEGTTYETEEKQLAVQAGTGAQEIELTLPKDKQEQLKKAQEDLKVKRQAEEEKAAKFEAEKGKITSFMQEYIQVVDNSIRDHTVNFSHYHDTNAYFHQELVEFAHSQHNRVGRSRNEFTVHDIKQDGERFIVSVTSRFTDYFRDGKSASQNQSQTYYLKPNGASYIIVDKDY